MSDCEYYEIETITIQRRPIGRTYRPKSGKAPWCSHQGSQVTQDMAMGPGGGNKLKCGGDLDKCPIRHLLDD